jgi:hypothetical protein
VLLIPPGSKEILSSYRLNFLHGVMSSSLAILAINNLVSESFASMTTISYFTVDFINMIFNDFFFKVKSYQTNNARKIEYAHHILCCSLGVISEFYYKKYCTFQMNPFIYLMFAELSTPFLIAWRHYNYDILFILFAIIFFCCRIIYHGFYLIPKCIELCEKSISYPFGIMYDLMNIFFMYTIINKALKKKKINN